LSKNLPEKKERRQIMKIIVRVLYILLMILSVCSYSEAVLLGSSNWNGININQGTSIDADLGFSSSRYSLDTDLNSIIFDSLIFPPAVAGTEYFATSSDPNFNTYANYLTNGINDWMVFFSRRTVSGATAMIRQESSAFGLGSAIDFNGYEINSIGLVIESIPPIPGTFNAIINVYGDPISEPIPEPTTMLLLGSGLIGLVGFRRKLRKK
jgi:hypothetical protein